MKISKLHRKAIAVLICLMLFTVFATTIFAAGDVSGAIQNTWNSAKEQIKSVVDTVIFPALDLILAVLFFIKIGSAYFDCAPVSAM